MPYNFNTKYELRTYKNIGECHEILFKARKSLIYKICMFHRNINNKNEKKYKKIDKFSQWEKYINEKFNEYSKEDLKNLRHYLKQKKRRAGSGFTVWTSVATPIYVFLLTFMLTMLTLENSYDIKAVRCISITTIIFAFYLFYTCSKYKLMYNFCRDYINILKEMENHVL